MRIGSRNAISPILAEIILIAITIAGGITVYNVFFASSSTASSSAQVQITYASLTEVTEAPLPASAISGCVGYWKFDEGSGTTTADSSGNGNTGTLMNSPAWVAGKFGDALSFGGSFVKTDNIGGFASNQPFTWSGWFYRQTIPTYYVDTFLSTRGSYTNTGSDPSSNGLIIYVDNYNTNNGAVVAKIGDGSTYSYENNFGGSNNFVPLQQWTSITLTNDIADQHLSLYLNGAYVGTFSYSGKTFGDVYSFTIGAAQGGFPAYASIDDVHVYNRALSANEIMGLYHSTAGTFTMQLKNSGSVPLQESTLSLLLGGSQLPGYTPPSAVLTPGDSMVLTVTDGFGYSFGDSVQVSVSVSSSSGSSAATAQASVAVTG